VSSVNAAEPIRTWRVGCVRDVARGPVPFHGIGERLADDAVGVADGARREPRRRLHVAAFRTVPQFYASRAEATSVSQGRFSACAGC
jgi:hypothetical protein